MSDCARKATQRFWLSKKLALCNLYRNLMFYKQNVTGIVRVDLISGLAVSVCLSTGGFSRR